MTRKTDATRAAIGARLLRRREALNLTQAEVAKVLGITPASVSGWERGAAMPDPAHQLALSKLYKVSMEWILAGAAGDASPQGLSDRDRGFDPQGADPRRAAAPRHKRLPAGDAAPIDSGALMGEATEAILAVYGEAGVPLRVAEAVNLASTLAAAAGPFESEAAARRAVDLECQRLRQFLNRHALALRK